MRENLSGSVILMVMVFSMMVIIGRYRVIILALVARPKYSERGGVP
jgi:hypothetical protein